MKFVEGEKENRRKNSTRIKKKQWISKLVKWAYTSHEHRRKRNKCIASVSRNNKVRNNQPLTIDLCSHLSLLLFFRFSFFSFLLSFIHSFTHSLTHFLFHLWGEKAIDAHQRIQGRICHIDTCITLSSREIETVTGNARI